MPNTWATILTISNNSRVPAQYNNLQTAINAANAGDTLHIQPSATIYESAIINKYLVLVGGGYYNTSQYFLGEESRLQLLTLTQNADQTFIADCHIENIIIESDNANQTQFDNLSLVHNFIAQITFKTSNGVFKGENITIKNNLINKISFTNWALQNEVTIKIENNIIGAISDAAGVEILIKNNLFYPRFGSGVTVAMSNLSDCMINGNIFLGNNAQAIGANTISNCNVSQNLSFLTTDDFSSATENNNTFSNNILLGNAADLLFNTVVDFYSLGTVINLDFALVTTSQAIGAGASGTDIGILGGSFPFVQSNKFAYPLINSVEINNPVIGQDEKLKFTIKAVYPNDN